MIVYYTPASGAILCAISAASDPGTYPANPGTPLYLDDTTYADVWAHLGWYLIQDNLPVAQPAWSVTATASTSTAGEYTLTATLNNPPSAPATSVTLALAGSTLTTAVTNNTATATIQLHATVASQPVTVTASATNTVSGSTTINPGVASDVPLQLLTSTTPPTVAPASGEAGRAWCRAYYMAFTPASQLALLTRALQNLAQAVSVAGEILTNKVLPALTGTTYTPITLSSAEQAALANWQANVGPNLLTLADLLDSSGNPTPAYSELTSQAPEVIQALTGYNAAVIALGL